jgi:hypothetical protein
MNEHDVRRGQHLDRARLLAAGLPAETGFSHETAAMFRGLATYGIPAQLRVTGTKVRAVRTSDLHVHRAGLRDTDVTYVDGLPVTSLARTAVDIGRSVDFAAALVTADAALRAGASRGQMQEVLRHQWTWPRVRHAMPVVRHADARSESPAESVVRSRFITRGLPMPQLQHNVFDGPTWIARTDFYWEEFGLVGEVDGRVKYVEDELRQEKLRQESIEDAAPGVIRWTWAQAHAPATRRARGVFGPMSLTFAQGGCAARANLCRVSVGLVALAGA